MFTSFLHCSSHQHLVKTHQHIRNGLYKFTLIAGFPLSVYLDEEPMHQIKSPAFSIATIMTRTTKRLRVLMQTCLTSSDFSVVVFEYRLICEKSFSSKGLGMMSKTKITTSILKLSLTCVIKNRTFRMTATFSLETSSFSYGIQLQKLIYAIVRAAIILLSSVRYYTAKYMRMSTTLLDNFEVLKVEPNTCLCKFVNFIWEQ